MADGQMALSLSYPASAQPEGIPIVRQGLGRLKVQGHMQYPA
ncbi:hypothetical protein AH4AK4_3938 [Aeromonas hydrophila 4AK4]|nr:hypothetical protein AH4AK4_3938 [Aeromonas hydrophila 4AK4]